MRYSERVFVASKIASVTLSGAGPPFGVLNFTPKSSSGPPGLWLADKMMPPSVLRRRIRCEAAGVERMAPCPTMTRAAPLAAAIRRITWAARSLK